MEKGFLSLAHKHVEGMNKAATSYKRSVAYYDVLWDDKQIMHNGNTSCHAGLIITHRNDAKPISVLNSVQNLLCDTSTARVFLEWLFNYSPYNMAFVTKDAEQALKDGIVITDCDVPANRLIGGLVAQRAITEHQHTADIWEGLVEHGVHPSIAFMYAHYFKGTKKEKIGIAPQEWHVAVDGNKLQRCGERYMLNFLQSKAKDQETFKDKGKYTTISDFWQYPENDEAKEYKVVSGIQGFFSELTATKTTANPFRAAEKAVAMSVPFKEGIKAIAKYLSDGYKGATNDTIKA